MTLPQRILGALFQVENGDPLKDWLDDDDILEGLELLKWYIEKFGEYE